MHETLDWGLWPLMVLKPFADAIYNPNARLFWAYMLAGVFIAGGVHALSGSKRSFASEFLSREVWLSRSALNDYGILLLNPVILFAWFSYLIAFAGELSSWTGDLVRWAGVTGEVTGPLALLISAALTIMLFLANDFVHWLVHYMSHRIPIWWEFHKVHHSAETLNFATAERFHPIDVCLTSSAFIAAAALVNGLFIGLFGDQLTVATVAGANVISVGFNLLGGVLRHSPTWVSFGPRVECWLISPAMHHIHHSGDHRHFDRNFGGALAVWDRWFGTLYVPQGREIFAYGIGRETEKYRTLRALYLLPFLKVWRKFRAKLRPTVAQRCPLDA